MFQFWVAALFAVYSLVHLGVLELRLSYSTSHSTLQEMRQFELLSRHAKKLAIVAAVPFAAGVLVLSSGRIWGIVPMLLGQGIGWVTLTHWLGAKRIARRARPAASFRPLSWATYASALGASVAGAGIIMYLREGPSVLLWLLPMGIFALVGLVVIRMLTPRRDAGMEQQNAGRPRP